MKLKYLIDGVDMKTYGVSVSKTTGLTSKPKPKSPLSVEWDDYNGVVVDLSGNRTYESRTIKFDCYIKTEAGFNDFITKANAFLALFDKPWTRRLTVVVDGSEPLVYEVFLDSEIEIDKNNWDNSLMIGTFSMSLREPEPVKRVIKYTRTSASDKTVSITVTSTKLLNVYWGDGSHTFDVSGTAQTITHDFAANGTFYIVVTGNIDDITSLTTTGKVVWNKLF